MEDSVYAVIDTNVIVSALISSKPDSNPMKVMMHLFSGSIIPVWNDEILSEYKEVLSREKFHIDSHDIEEVISFFKSEGLCLERTPVLNVTFPDPKDAVFYEVKMSKEDAYLVTGNKKHFPSDPSVLTPHDMADLMET